MDRRSIWFDCWEKNGMMTWCNANDAKKKATNQTNHTMKLGNHGSHLKLRSWGVTQYENPGSAIDYWLEMCLSHVYIVLEPVGSARLTFDDDLYCELCDLMTEDCSEYRMWSWTWQGVSKWSRGKDRYIGRIYSDTGMVPKCFGYFLEYREVTGTSRRSSGP